MHWALAVVGALLVAPTTLHAGSMRLWPTAVVVQDTIRLDDLCALHGFDADTQQRLARLSFGDAPPPGGSRIIHIELVRRVLSGGGANLARITLGGATECAVTRPSLPDPPTADARPAERGRSNDGDAGQGRRAEDPAERSSRQSLRGAVREYFNEELRRYGARAELVFDHTSDQVLELSGPEFAFHVRRKSNSPLGLVPLEVEVLSEGRSVQTVPLVVQVSMVLPVVTAARAINQEATIQPADVQVIPLTFKRLDGLGTGDPAQVIGQRAKRFIPAGTVIDPGMLEEVPLVMRGQLVTLISQVGPVRVVTSAKAAQTGSLGDVVKVRAAENHRIEFNGVVIAPAKVRIGTNPATRSGARGRSRLATVQGAGE